MIGYSPNRKKRIKQNWEGPFKNTGQKKKKKEKMNTGQGKWQELGKLHYTLKYICCSFCTAECQTYHSYICLLLEDVEFESFLKLNFCYGY